MTAIPCSRVQPNPDPGELSGRYRHLPDCVRVGTVNGSCPITSDAADRHEVGHACKCSDLPGRDDHLPDRLAAARVVDVEGVRPVGGNAPGLGKERRRAQAIGAALFTEHPRERGDLPRRNGHFPYGVATRVRDVQVAGLVAGDSQRTAEAGGCPEPVAGVTEGRGRSRNRGHLASRDDDLANCKAVDDIDAVTLGAGDGHWDLKTGGVAGPI